MLKLFRRRSCLCPTPACWVLIVLLVLGSALAAGRSLHAFLSPTQIMHARILVIEGWLGDEELLRAAGLASTGRYRVVITTGGPLSNGAFLSEYKTYAQLSKASLERIGLFIPVVAVPTPAVPRDRTYHSALAVKSWLALRFPDIRTVDLVTVGPHARRSRLLYREAFGKGYDVGIIALPSGAYDASRWWTSSAGVRTVIGESIAWLYASLIFSPPER